VLLDHLVLTGLQVVVEEVVKIPPGVQVEDREVPMLEEEVGAELYQHIQKQMVTLVYKTLVEAVVE
jgi:hypothetical protein